MNETGKCQAAKAELRKALATFGGDTKNEFVAAAIKKLSAPALAMAPDRYGSLLEGKWLLISAANFPDGEQRSDGKWVFTLGRIAFNMFQPIELKVVIDRVLQPVLSLAGEQRSYDIIVEFTTVDERFPKLAGVVRNLGVCQPISDSVLQVKFKSGALEPQVPNQINDWKAVFGKQRQSSNTSWKEKLSSTIFQVMFGLVPPKGMNPETGEISFTMHRSPKGSLKILYLDEELRITRGERGTVLVCERQ